ncbi:polyprenyl synthetase family protein [Ferroacidibacillus organovorans]|nr:farnesyl diphosphate synthase [Ferroacidibacillus organovorans]
MIQTVEQQWSQMRDVIEKSLLSFLPERSLSAARLLDAMTYSLLGGGKRLRPTLLLMTARACGLPIDRVLPTACAVEMIHTYSLIHDDLPAMDNDDYRRGKLTNHKQFDEATAILAGDALLTLAFETILLTEVDAQTRLFLVRELSQASGARGMVAGQMLDLLAEGKRITDEQLVEIHAKKTGALLRASVRMGALAAEVNQETLCALTIYAESIGLAFQIQDDILDVTGDVLLLGKQTGADLALQKATYPARYGLAGARDRVKELTQRAVNAIQEPNLDLEASTLIDLAYLLTERVF